MLKLIAFQQRAVRTLKKRKQNIILQETYERLCKFVNLGYKVEAVWECEIRRMLDKDIEMQ